MRCLPMTCVRTTNRLVWASILALSITSCGDAYDFSGFGEDCSTTATGKYSGVAVSNAGKRIGTILLSLNQKGHDSCELHGATALRPCVPVTAITGKAGWLAGFVVETETSNPYLRIDALSFHSPPSTRARGPEYTIGETFDADYTLTNQGVEGCPASHSGTVTLTRTE